LQWLPVLQWAWGNAFQSFFFEKSMGTVSVLVNIASAGGILALPNLAAYCASKFGVIGFTDYMRHLFYLANRQNGSGRINNLLQYREDRSGEFSKTGN
jgi:NAD(P)-dependent dehydrogenase (short-subunit alcohol dehydrogenase family)